MEEISFGVWLSRYRRYLGLTQKQLAKNINCATISLRKIEAGQRRPSMQVAERLAQVLNIPLEEQSAFYHFARGYRLMNVQAVRFPWNDLPLPRYPMELAAAHPLFTGVDQYPLDSPPVHFAIQDYTYQPPEVVVAQDYPSQVLATFSDLRIFQEEKMENKPLVSNDLRLRWPVWIGIVCEDLEAQRHFYKDVLGLVELNHGDHWVWFDFDGKLLELLSRSSLPQYDRPGVTFAFAVDDIYSARAALLARGVEPVSGIEGGPESLQYWAYFRDAEGNLFELVQRLK